MSRVCRKGRGGWCRRALVRWAEHGQHCGVELAQVCGVQRRVRDALLVWCALPGAPAARGGLLERAPYREVLRARHRANAGQGVLGEPTCPVHGTLMVQLDEDVYECPRVDCGRQLLDVQVVVMAPARPALRLVQGGKA